MTAFVISVDFYLVMIIVVLCRDDNFRDMTAFVISIDFYLVMIIVVFLQSGIFFN